MKKSVCIASLLVAGCAFNAAQQQQPGLAEIVEGCYAAGAQTLQLSQCAASVLSQRSPQWKERSDYKAVTAFFAVTNELGKAVSERKLAEPLARYFAVEYLSALQDRERARILEAEQLNLTTKGQPSVFVSQQDSPKSCTYTDSAGVIRQVCM